MKNDNPCSPLWSGPYEWIQMDMVAEENPVQEESKDKVLSEISFSCSAMNANCKDFPLLLPMGAVAYLTLSKSHTQREKSFNVGLPLVKTMLKLPTNTPSHNQMLRSQDILYARHSIHVTHCLLTLLLFSLATSWVMKAGCLGATLRAQFFCKMLIHT